MKNLKAESSVEAIRDRLIAKWTSPAGQDLIHAGDSLVKQLFAGQPISLEEAEKLTGVPANQILKWWKKRNYILEVNQNNDIVGAGLTLVPTHHAFEVDGKTFYGWCAMDILMFPLVLNKSALIRSQCPSTKVEISMLITDTVIKQLIPATAVVSLAPPEGSDIRKSFCNRTNFYSCEDVARHATHSDPEIVIAKVSEAYSIAKDLAKLF
jgi:alkylmercury lyase